MKDSKWELPLVSVVIPVYNAEKYLGYCLNSVMSQTYTNLDIVLVNDGSKDGSLEICRNYAAADPRFRVFDIPNGGVSNARNLAMTKVQGSYVTFVDSDDTIHPEMIQWMMEAEEKYHTGLVIGDLQTVDFSTGEVLPSKLTSSWLGEQRHLTKEEFCQKKMELIWNTSLLEGQCSKLYSVDTWKANNVHCPTDVSLGEDFLANMQYYSACNGVYFLDKTVYYYNNLQDSGSLSHKYRSDLFQIKMMLVENLEKHLGGVEHISEKEQKLFYGYAATYGLFCVSSVCEAKNVAKDEKIKLLKEMTEHSLFMTALREANYIPPQYADYVPLLLGKKVDRILVLSAEKKTVPNREPESEYAQRHRPMWRKSEPSPCLLNRWLRKVLRALARSLGDNSFSRWLSNIEKSLAKVGIKRTFRHYFKKRKLEPSPGLINRMLRTVLRKSEALLGDNKVSRWLGNFEQSLAQVGIKRTFGRCFKKG